MTTDVIQAISILYSYYSRLRSHENSQLDRIDGALDYLIRNPEKLHDPKKLAYIAWGNAGKFVRSRGGRQVLLPVDVGDAMSGNFVNSSNSSEVASVIKVQNASAVADYLEYLDCEVTDFIAREGFCERDKNILTYLHKGYTAEEIADTLGIPLKQARVIITRARNRAKNAWGMVS